MGILLCPARPELWPPQWMRLEKVMPEREDWLSCRQSAAES
ncbi:hypothetical protein [Synechococcus sp. BL107]|nr:hypothetical protein [Synechococcus sp. BL107]